MLAHGLARGDDSSTGRSTVHLRRALTARRAIAESAGDEGARVVHLAGRSRSARQAWPLAGALRALRASGQWAATTCCTAHHDLISGVYLAATGEAADPHPPDRTPTTPTKAVLTPSPLQASDLSADAAARFAWSHEPDMPVGNSEHSGFGALLVDGPDRPTPSSRRTSTASIPAPFLSAPQRDRASFRRRNWGSRSRRAYPALRRAHDASAGRTPLLFAVEVLAALRSGGCRKRSAVFAGSGDAGRRCMREAAAPRNWVRCDAVRLIGWRERCRRR